MSLFKTGKQMRFNHQINFMNGGLIPANAPMTQDACEKSLWFHPNGDDATPWSLNGTYIGGNHGANDVVEVTAKAHGLTVATSGTSLKKTPPAWRSLSSKSWTTTVSRSYPTTSGKGASLAIRRENVTGGKLVGNLSAREPSP